MPLLSQDNDIRSESLPQSTMTRHTFTAALDVANWLRDHDGSPVDFAVLVVSPDAEILFLRSPTNELFVPAGKYKDGRPTALHAVVDVVHRDAQLDVERIAAVLLQQDSLSAVFVVRAVPSGSKATDAAPLWLKRDGLERPDIPSATKVLAESGFAWIHQPQNKSAFDSADGVLFKNNDDAFPVRSPIPQRRVSLICDV